MEERKIKITKMFKKGPSKSVGSSFGFGSWTIGATDIEIEVDPPIDLTTDEGKESYKKLKDTLTKMGYKALQEDVQYMKDHDKEFSASISKREMLVNNAIASEENNG